MGRGVRSCKCPGRDAAETGSLRYNYVKLDTAAHGYSRRAGQLRSHFLCNPEKLGASTVAVEISPLTSVSCPPHYWLIQKISLHTHQWTCRRCGAEQTHADEPKVYRSGTAP